MMTIKTATQLVILGIAITFFMSILGPFLLSWMVRNSALTSEHIGMIQTAWYSTLSVLHYGSLLIFFIALRSRQQA
jgi:hypothetical protein